MISRSTLLFVSTTLATFTAFACGDNSGEGTGGAGATSASTTTATTSAQGTTSSSSVASGTGGEGAQGGGGSGSGTAGGGGAVGTGGGGGTACDDVIPPQPEPPELLSETGLYSNIADRTIDPRVQAFSPEFKLWSDGAEKSRWVYLPACTTIDITDMDHWQLPVGARLFKDFVVNGQLLETRVIHRYGPNVTDWWMTSYAWEPEGGDAVRSPDGVFNAGGTQHDIPSEGACVTCHDHLEERALGFSAIQLAWAGEGNGGATLDTLEAEGWLSAEPPAIVIPAADEVERQAMGYLHANCGNCHNEDGLFFPTPFDMRLSVFDATREDTGVLRTAVDVETDSFGGGGVTHRILSGDPTLSCVSYRMGNAPRMPPLGTEVVDATGKAAVDAWISSLP